MLGLGLQQACRLLCNSSVNTMIDVIYDICPNMTLDLIMFGVIIHKLTETSL